MALDDYYADSNLAIARQRAIGSLLRPEPPPTPAFSIWGTVRGLVKGIPQAAAERSAGLFEIFNGFSEVAGAYPEALGVTPTEEQRKQADAQRQKILTKGVDMDSELSSTLRDVAHSYAADPATAHTAEQVVHGFSRFVAKAAAGGVVPLVVDEALTTATDLQRKGVDPTTRMKAGAVAAVGAGAAMLPLAGPSIKATLGLYAAGGPGGFMAQQAATRAILAEAGYADLSKQYDPFDPLGLTLATAIPLPFAGLAVRGIKARERFGAETRRILEGHSDAVDAARVQMTQEVGQSANRAAAGDLRGLAAHSEAMDTAVQQTLRAEPVRVELPADQQARIEAEMAPRVEPVLMRWADEQARLAKDEAQTARTAELTAAEREALVIERAMPRERADLDIATVIRDARELLAGKQPHQVIADLQASGKLTPELNNTVIALSEFGRDPGQLAQLLGNYAAEAKRAGPDAHPMDVIANAVEATRSGAKPAEPAAPVSPFDQHAERLRAQLPDLPVETADGQRTTLANALDEISATYKRDTNEANLAMVAAQCFLELA